MLKILTREATIIDFVSNKGRGIWKWYRGVGKTINFALIFAAQVPTLAAQLKDSGFEEEDCDKAITDLGLALTVRKYAENPRKDWITDRDKRVMPKYLACAEHFRKAFFDAYPGIEDRCIREFEFAKKHGYVRSWHGPVRHLPELKLMYFEPKSTKPSGADMSYFSGMASHSKNTAGNSTIQTLEAYHAFTTLHEVVTNLKNWGFHSRLVNMVHDSGDFEVKRDEADLVYALIGYCSNKPKPPYIGVPIVMDGEAADFSKGDYYKHGNGFDIPDFQEALKSYNAKYGTNLTFTETCPL
jgi:DNA polymerase I-like protein with 3'-5' exonuclease and polymerase domains